MPKDQVIAAAIDLGSNSFRLLIGSPTEEGLSCLLKKRSVVRLGMGLTKTGTFSTENIEQALLALAAFRLEIDRFGATLIRCCGTEAFRRAANREALTVPAKEILDTPVTILDGKEEAELSCLGVISALGDRLSFPCLIADVGGGSTELILLRSAESRPVVISLPVGVVSFAERDKTSQTDDLNILASGLKKLTCGLNQPPSPLLVGTGGTAGSLAALAQKLPHHDSGRIHGHFLTGQRLEVIYTSLAGLNARQRQKQPGLEAGREDIIMPGLEIYQEILATIGGEGMMVSEAGLLEGILLSITRGYRT